jgi:hypothetical protein
MQEGTGKTEDQPDSEPLQEQGERRSSFGRRWAFAMVAYLPFYLWRKHKQNQRREDIDRQVRDMLRKRGVQGF